MALDLSYEEILTDDEIQSALAIGQEGLNLLEEQGLAYIEVDGRHFYLASSLLAFMKRAERKSEGEGTP